jgi:hypothetical protein
MRSLDKMYYKMKGKENEALIKFLEDVIENIKKDEKYNVGIEITPNVSEMINWNGKGKRYTTYTRAIIITDREAIVEDIDRRL